MNTLAIAFKGQIFDEVAGSTNIVYPSNNNQWANLIPGDTRSVLTHLGVNECYTMAIVPEGVIYAYRQKIGGRSGSNTALVAILAPGPTKDSNRLIEILKELLDYVCSQKRERDIQDTFLKAKLDGIKDLFYSNRKPQSTDINDSTEESTNKASAYRTYQSSDELNDIFEQPYQPVYHHYGLIHIAENVQSASMITMRQITNPLQKVYFFAFPDDAHELEKRKYICENEGFVIVYKKKGYIPTRYPKNKDRFDNASFRIKDKSDYFKVEGDVINVQSAEALKGKVVFRKEVNVEVTDNMGNHVAGCDIKCQDKNVNCKIEEKEDRYTIRVSDGKYEFKIKHPKYEDGEINITISDSCKINYHIELKPVGIRKRVHLRPSKLRIGKNGKDDAVMLQFPANVLVNEHYHKKLDPDRDNEPTFYLSRLNLAWVAILSALLGMAIGYGVSKVIPGKVNSSGNQDLPSTTDTTQTTEKKEKKEPTPEEVEQNKEKNDTAYLNNTNTWYRDSIYSQKYRYFFDSVVCNKANYDTSTLKKYPEINNAQWIKIRNIIINCKEREREKEGMQMAWADYKNTQYGNTINKSLKNKEFKNGDGSYIDLTLIDRKAEVTEAGEKRKPMDPNAKCE